jgi:hypothetical protein
MLLWKAGRGSSSTRESQKVNVILVYLTRDVGSTAEDGGYK